MKKSTMFRSLLLSGLSMLLCVSMLMGSTFAWFTDTVESGINTIVAGNLDVELYHADKGTNGILAVVENNTILFDDVDSKLWEPGAMVYEKFAVENAGTLALKYALTLNVTDDTVIDDVSFASMLKVAVVKDKTFVYTRENIAALTNWQSLASFTLEGVLTAGAEDDIFGIVIWWQPSENDNLFNMNNGKTGIASVKVGVNLFATQVEAESDSFGPDYDADAPIVSAPVARPENATPLNIKGAEDVVIGLPADVVENLPTGVTEIGLSVSEPVVDATAKTITFASIELVDQDGDVIDLEALNTNTNITVTLPAQTTFAPGETVVLYHDGKYVATAVVNADTTITYEVAHLCEVSVGVIEEPVVNGNTVEIANVAQLIAFAQSVNAGNTYAGKTVVLTADIDLNNVDWTPIGSVTFDRANSGSYVVNSTFNGTFDGQGHTISNLKVNAPAVNGVALFGAVKDAVIKNLEIKNVDIVADGTAAAIVGYTCDYSLTEMTSIENCHVSGNISIVADWAYVGGIAAYGHANITDCSVIADGTGVLTSENRNAVGGIMGWNYGSYVQDCEVANLALTAWANVAGVEGYVPAAHTVSGCSVENVTLTKTRIDGRPSIGLLVAGWSYSAAKAITLSNNTVNGATMTATHIAYDVYNVLYGSEYSTSVEANFVLENNTVANVTNNLVEIVKVKDTNELKAALKDNVTLYLSGTSYTLPSLGAYTGVTLMGAPDGSTKVSGVNSFNFGTDTTIKNITFTTSSNNSVRYATTAGDVVYENCVFEGKQYGYHVDNANNGTITFNGCTFYGRNALAASGTYFFNDCTFEYTYSNYNTTNIYSEATFNNCKWKSKSNSVLELAIDTGAKAIIDGDVITERVVFIADAKGMENFQRSVNSKNETYKGVTVMLSADIDMSEAYYATWTPIGQTGATQFMGTFDGHGYTISNLKVDSTKKTGANYASGLFGWLNNATIKNLNIDNATIIANHYVGVIAGYMETAGCTISNCNVTNSTITATHINDDVCGDKVGVIVGFAGNSGVKVENCTAENCTVVAGRDAGQIVGAALTANVTGCTATNVTVTADGTCTGANVREEVIGRVIG